MHHTVTGNKVYYTAIILIRSKTPI